MELKILGKVNKDLLFKLKYVLESNSLSSELIVFCDYSLFNIPVGHSFKKIYNSEGKCIYNGEILLNRVTQENGLIYKLIPYGYKTICKLVFPRNDMPNELTNNIPIKDWYNSTTYYVLR